MINKNSFIKPSLHMELYFLLSTINHMFSNIYLNTSVSYGTFGYLYTYIPISKKDTYARNTYVSFSLTPPYLKDGSIGNESLIKSYFIDIKHLHCTWNAYYS